MSDFAPHPVRMSYDFGIARNDLGHWTVRERHALSGGVFLTRKDALRFALSETGWDASHVHATRGAPIKRRGR